MSCMMMESGCVCVGNNELHDDGVWVCVCVGNNELHDDGVWGVCVCRQ
jgi:Ni,Fe-hydrogenase maturation factor